MLNFRSSPCSFYLPHCSWRDVGGTAGRTARTLMTHTRDLEVSRNIWRREELSPDCRKQRQGMNLPLGEGKGVGVGEAPHTLTPQILELKSARKGFLPLPLPSLVQTFSLGPSPPDGLKGKKRGKSVSNLLYSEQWEGICISILSLC